MTVRDRIISRRLSAWERCACVQIAQTVDPKFDVSRAERAIFWFKGWDRRYFEKGESK